MNGYRYQVRSIGSVEFVGVECSGKLFIGARRFQRARAVLEREKHESPVRALVGGGALRQRTADLVFGPHGRVDTTTKGGGGSGSGDVVILGS